MAPRKNVEKWKSFINVFVEFLNFNGHILNDILHFVSYSYAKYVMKINKPFLKWKELNQIILRKELFA